MVCVCVCVHSTENPQVGPSHFRVTEQKQQDVITPAVIYPVGLVHRDQSLKSLLKDRQLASAELGLKAGLTLCLLPSTAKLKVLAPKAGKAEMPGDKALSCLI